MIAPSPDLVAAVIALPLEARRLLVQQPGPGWHVGLGCSSVTLYADVPERCLQREWWQEHYQPQAWFPASEVAWMDAATPEGGGWDSCWEDGGRLWIVYRPRASMGLPWTAPTAPLCALAALRARFPVTP